MLTLILLAILGSFIGISGWFWGIWWICFIFSLIWTIIKLIAATQG